MQIRQLNKDRENSRIDCLCLKGLHKGPEKYPDGVTLSEQLDQPGCSEELEETHVDGVHRLQQTHKRLERTRVADRRERQDVKTQMVKFITT